MGAGGPGDLPVTDIVRHGIVRHDIDLPGDGLDDRVRDRLRRHPAEADRLAEALWRVLPTWGPAKAHQKNAILAVLEQTASGPAPASSKP